jgi:PBP1b-binding outer membrane lipoprotein LpoB
MILKEKTYYNDDEKRRTQMKKILMIMSLFLLLSACGAKTASWDDVKEKYTEAYQAAVNDAAGYEEYSAAQFQSLIDQIFTGVGELNSGVKADAEEDILSLYKNAALLEQLSQRSNSVQSRTLGEFADAITKLIQAAYEKSSDFDALKSQILAKAEEITGWSDEDWKLAAFKKKISWAQVVEAYETLEEETISNLPRADKISELELEEFKNTIINNYELIQDGVNEDNRENADVIYEAAVSLREYTQDLQGETAEKVLRFANQTIDYVRQAYGEKVEDPDYDFLKTAEEARKWTLSVWNELIKLINL